MSAYAQLLNIDLVVPEKLSHFAADCISEEIPQKRTYRDELRKYVEQKDTKQLIATLFANIDSVLQKSGEEEVDSFIQASVSVMYTLSEDGVDHTDSIASMVSSLVSSTGKPKLRLCALVTLLNLVVETNTKYSILTAIFQVALSTSQPKLVTHFHNRIDEWIASWGLSVAEKRNIYQTMSELLSGDGQSSVALVYLIKYFNTYMGQKYPIEVEAVAITAVLSAIKSPVSSFADRNALFESFSRQSLGGDLASLVNLLRIICVGKLSDFTAIASQKPAFLTQYNIDADHVEYNMRLMSLCSLGCEKTIITYREIAATLAVDEAEVEDWVVDAVGQGLMEAHMDQSTSVVCVSRSAHRSFGMDQWMSVQEKLRHLRSKVSAVLDAVKKHSSER